MQNAECKTVRCFICRSKKTRINFKNIEKAVVPNSKKPLKAVLIHLAKFIKSKLKLPSDASVCQRCYRDLVEYDDFVLKLLEVQRRLAKMIEKALSERGKSPSSSDDNLGDDSMEWVAIEVNHDDDTYTNKDDEEDDELTLADIKASLGPIEEEEISLPSVVVKLETEDEEEFKEPNTKEEERRFRKKDKRPICTVCGITLKDEEYLDLHMNLHEGKTETECRYCDKRFSRKRNVLRHMQVHWDKKKFQCDKCGLCFKQQIVLWNHRQHHEAEKQPPRCEICGMVFKTKRTYTHHMVTHRPDRPRYSCEYCGKTFTEKYTLKVHKRTHPETEAASTATPTEQIQQPLEHQQFQEEKEDIVAEPKVNCIICDLQFTNKDTLNNHMESEHDVITMPLTITNFSQYEVVAHESKRRAKVSLNQHLDQMQGASAS